MNNPFQFGQAVNPSDYILPSDEMLTSIAGRIIDNGQSVAIVSEPRFGKTSLLYYLSSPGIVAAINNLRRDWQYIFRFIDVHMFQKEKIDIGRFWQYAIKPVEEYSRLANIPSLTESLAICKQDNYDVFDVEELLSAMADNKIRLVILIDEFDDLLNHPVFGTNEFLGSLRGLATHNASLTVVIASRLTVSDLNSRTRTIHTSTGSPYINYFMQISLEAFATAQVDSLLARADELFSSADRQFIKSIAGYHPYFLQVSSHSLYEIKSRGAKIKIKDLYTSVWNTLCEQAPITFYDTWSFWTLRMKQVLAVIAIDDISRLLGKTFDIAALRATLQNCAPEIEYFQKLGYIVKVSENSYSLSSQIIAWWCSKILTEAIQSKDELGNWLMSEHKDGFLKNKHKEQILQAGAFMIKAIENNKDVFIKMIIDKIIK